LRWSPQTSRPRPRPRRPWGRPGWGGRCGRPCSQPRPKCRSQGGWGRGWTEAKPSKARIPSLRSHNEIPASIKSDTRCLLASISINTWSICLIFFPRSPGKSNSTNEKLYSISLVKKVALNSNFSMLWICWCTVYLVRIRDGHWSDPIRAGLRLGWILFKWGLF
jgi:hypothetical protein